MYGAPTEITYEEMLTGTNSIASVPMCLRVKLSKRTPASQLWINLKSEGLRKQSNWACTPFSPDEFIVTFAAPGSRVDGVTSYVTFYKFISVEWDLISPRRLIK
jgi:hypothetical protein